MRLVPTDERGLLGAVDHTAPGMVDAPRQVLLDIVAQPRVRHQLDGLGALRDELRLPLRDGRAILQLAATSRRVAFHFTGDRGGTAADAARAVTGGGSCAWLGVTGTSPKASIADNRMILMAAPGSDHRNSGRRGG